MTLTMYAVCQIKIEIRVNIGMVSTAFIHVKMTCCITNVIENSVSCATNTYYTILLYEPWACELLY